MLLAVALAGCAEEPVAPTPRPRSPAPVHPGPGPERPGVVGFDPACEVPGTVCVWLGSPGSPGQTVDGLPRVGDPGEGTLLDLPIDATFAPDGTAYVLDYDSHRVRRVAPDGLVTTAAGGGGGDPFPTDCSAGCDALDAPIGNPTDLWLQGDALWIAAWSAARIDVVDLAAGSLTWFAGEGAVLDDLLLHQPSSVALGDDGSVYVSDQAQAVVHRITPQGDVEVVAGEPGVPGHDGDGGPAEAAHLRLGPDFGAKLALDGPLLYVADTGNSVVRVVDLDTGRIDALAGNGAFGYGGDGGDPLAAALDLPGDVAVAPDGSVYVADRRNRCVRVIAHGRIDGFAGACGAEDDYAGDGGPALDARFGQVYGVAVDTAGDVYVADTGYHVIRRVKG